MVNYSWWPMFCMCLPGLRQPQTVISLLITVMTLQVHPASKPTKAAAHPSPPTSYAQTVVNLCNHPPWVIASEEFNASAYHDEVYDKTMELIQNKIDGQQITAAPVEESKTQIIDLMAALKASIAESGTERKPATRAEKKPAKKSGAKKSTRKKAASG